MGGGPGLRRPRHLLAVGFGALELSDQQGGPGLPVQSGQCSGTLATVAAAKSEVLTATVGRPRGCCPTAPTCLQPVLQREERRPGRAGPAGAQGPKGASGRPVCGLLQRTGHVVGRGFTPSPPYTWWSAEGSPSQLSSWAPGCAGHWADPLGLGPCVCKTRVAAGGLSALMSQDKLKPHWSDRSTQSASMGQKCCCSLCTSPVRGTGVTGARQARARCWAVVTGWLGRGGVEEQVGQRCARVLQASEHLRVRTPRPEMLVIPRAFNRRTAMVGTFWAGATPVGPGEAAGLGVLLPRGPLGLCRWVPAGRMKAELTVAALTIRRRPRSALPCAWSLPRRHRSVLR